jgi:hypothetical protein
MHAESPGDLLGPALHFFAQLGAARFGLGIEVGDAGDLDPPALLG